MEIRLATETDLPALEQIFAEARIYMAENGNKDQWTDGYPDRELILQDIQKHSCHICQEDGQILGVFSYFEEPDPTYAYLDEGSWLNDAPYGVIHRVAVRAHQRGVASFCLDHCFARCGNLRADTHRDNLPMQRTLDRNGFRFCGVIHLASGDPRIAYQRIE